MLERRRIIYRGRVQGVGFRATAQRLAQGWPVAGFVKNLPNGSVEVVVEGDTATIEGFLARLAERLASSIEQADARMETPEGLDGFAIRY